MTDRFGDYRLIRYLTAGGMADLYLAHRAGSDEDLVLKRIQQRYLDHTRVVKLFIDEGRIAQTLAHPNIVRVVDVGNLDGTWYIAMEYISGHDLIAIARRGVETGRPLPRTVAVGLVAQVATGLAFAHSRTDDEGKPLSIVHCDISPGNVVVSWRGTAKIVDFGIARATIALREQEHVAGKYNYMSPEQIRGQPVDARADLFALGVILYELTLGKRLFKGRPEVVRRKVLDGRIPRPRELAADYPPELERILSRLLARDPDQRYSSAAALRSDLRSFLATQGDGWTKREIARYLRDLFRASRDITVADEFEGAGDDELVLEHAMPHLVDASDEVDSDPDDLDEVSATFSNAFARDRSEMARTVPDMAPLPARQRLDLRETAITAPDLPPLARDLSVTSPDLSPRAHDTSVTSPDLPPFARDFSTTAPDLHALPDLDTSTTVPDLPPLPPRTTVEMMTEVELVTPPPEPAPVEAEPRRASTEEMLAAAPINLEPAPPADEAKTDEIPVSLPASDETTPNAIGPPQGSLRVGEIVAPAAAHDEPPRENARAVEIGGATAPVRLPRTEERPPRPREPDTAPATALVRLPAAAQRREVLRVATSTEETHQVFAPRPSRRRRRRRLSSGVVIGGCMVVAAGVLLTLFLLLR